MKEKLKVGLLLTDESVSAWEFKIIEDIISSDHSKIDLIIKTGPHTDAVLNKNIGKTLLSFHLKIDRFLFRHTPDYSNKKDISALLMDVPVISLKRSDDVSGKLIKKDDIQKIRKEKLDLILDLGTGWRGGELAQATRFGVCTYCMGNIGSDRIITTGYWQIFRNNIITYASLKIFDGTSDEAKIAAYSGEPTYPFSVNINRNRVFWRASLFTCRLLKGISEKGEDYLNLITSRYNNNVEINNKDNFLLPTVFAVFVNIFKSVILTLRQIIKKIIFCDDFDWIILFRLKDNIEVSGEEFSRFKKLRPPKDRFWADPFVVAENNMYYIFVEEFIYKTKKGHLTVLEVDNLGNLTDCQKILDLPYHLSYPNILKINGEYFMIPESSANRSIDLYKCTVFPYKWEYVKAIMSDISAVDTTPFYYQDKWWLFTSLDETNDISGYSTELFLFFSDDIFSDGWKSHPLNPVVSDVSRARPAGNIFMSDGRIIRPSQNCAERYGKGLNMNEIIRLSETEYEEKQLVLIEPDWERNLKGCHTFNSDENITVIDAYSYRKRIF